MVGVLFACLQHDLRILGRFVAGIDAGEVADLARPRLAVEALGVAPFAQRQRGVHEHLDELALLHQAARHPPLVAERRDQRDQNDQPGIDEQLRHLGDAADVLHPVGIGEAQVAVQAVADVVAIQQVAVAASRRQPAFHPRGGGGLARPRKAGEPQDAGPLALLAGALFLVDLALLPGEIGGAQQGRIDHAGSDRGVGGAVDEDEGAGLPQHPVGIEGDGPVEGQVAKADLVRPQRSGGVVLHGVDVDAVAQGGDLGGGGGGAGLQQILPLRQQRLVGHPQQMGVELVAAGWRRAVVGRQQVAAADVDLVGERQGHRLPGDGGGEVATGGDDAANGGTAPARPGADAVARPQGTGGYGAGIAAEIGAGATHPLHRHAEGCRRLVLRRGSLFQRPQQGGTTIPRRLRAGLEEVGAGERRDRDGAHIVDGEPGGEAAVVGGDGLEDRFVPAHQVHLVDGQHHPAQAQQGEDVAVAPRLRQHALAGIDQHHRQIGGRGAGRHVAGVLLVAGRVGDDEAAPAGGEETVGDVDGDALLALGLETVHKQRQVGGGALGAVLAAGGRHRRQLVGGDETGVVEQAPDQRRFAAVDAAADDQTQRVLPVFGFQPGARGALAGGGHQK